MVLSGNGPGEAFLIKEASFMAESAKTEFQAGVYTEQGRKESRHSSTDRSQEGHSYIVAPGLDYLYEFLNRYGLAILVAVLTYLSFWIIWAVDFSGGG
jgi:hypothetical protein